jgi:hypothetical protein
VHESESAQYSISQKLDLFEGHQRISCPVRKILRVRSNEWHPGG